MIALQSVSSDIHCEMLMLFEKGLREWIEYYDDIENENKSYEEQQSQQQERGREYKMKKTKKKKKKNWKETKYQ